MGLSKPSHASPVSAADQSECERPGLDLLGVLYLVLAPPFDYHYKDSGAWGLYARLVGVWLAVPGPLVSVLATRMLYRLLDWAGWAVIEFVCYDAYREMRDAGGAP